MRLTTFSASRWAVWGIVVFAINGGPAGEAATLRWKFKAGDTIRYEMDQRMVTTAKLNAGQEIKTTSNQMVNTSWTVKSVDASGLADLVLTIERVRTKIEAPYYTIEYDSQGGKEPTGPAATLLSSLKPLVGAQFSFKMNPKGEVTEVKVPEQVTKALREAGTAAPGDSMFSEDGLKRMITGSSLVLPAEDLAKGKTWNQQTQVPYPPIGKMIHNITYRYQGPGGNLERIGVETRIDIQADPGQNFEVKIKSQEGKGTYSFDNVAGRVSDFNITETIETLVPIMTVEIPQTNTRTATMKLVGP